MGVYDAFITIANRMISDKGGPVLVRRFSGTATDPAKPWLGSTRTVTDQATEAFTLPALPGSMFFREMELDPRAREVWYMSAGPITERLTLDDRLVRGGEEVTIVKFDLISPNGEDILYIVQVAA